MTGYRWIINNNILGLRNPKDDFIIPSADEIYKIETGKISEINGNPILRPSDHINHLSFSRYPLIPEIRLVDTPNPDNENIRYYSCIIVGLSGNTEINFPYPFSHLADHIISDSVWYPFVRGSLDALREKLNSNGIEKTGRISLIQYYSLLKSSDDAIKVRIERITTTERTISHDSVTDSKEIPGFTGTLYPYQNKGFEWLRMINNEGIGCILADEMGLGKTIQIICLLQDEKNTAERKPSLIVAPATLLENWRREIHRFAPGLQTLIHRGPTRTGYYKELFKPDIVLTSYDTTVRDQVLFQMVQWNIIILDEAQAIKNPDSQRSKSVTNLNRRASVAVTGTPVENSLLDLWSLFNFILPGYLGSRGDFEKKFTDSVTAATELEYYSSPVILRRKVLEVAGDLPERIDIPQVIELSQENSQQYEEMRLRIIEESGRSASLSCLIRLRMYCCHPWLVSDPDNDPTESSPKYQRMTEILSEIVENNEKSLIFTSFIKMEDILLSDLKKRFRGIYINNIDGRVPIENRQNIVDEFNSAPDSAILILNPKAAGTGLNLTGATHVIHYNPEWNPAIVDQASARAHRRGQDRPVTIHYLYYSRTVEDIMKDRLERKRDLFNNAIVGTTGDEDDYNDIVQAMSISPFD